MTSRIFKTAFLALVFAAPLAHADVYDNSDCYYQGQKLVRPCKTCRWEAISEDPDRFYQVMTRTSPTHYEYANAEKGLVASVDLDRETVKAKFNMLAPDAKKLETVDLEKDKDYPVIMRGLSYMDSTADDKIEAHQYRVFCAFGRSDVVREIKAKEEREMDRLGPAREWNDPNAPSLGTLPIGTVLELTSDFTAEPGGNVIVEQNGAMPDSSFNKIQLQYRFGFAHLMNANNTWMKKTSYPKGVKMQVTSITYRKYVTVGGEYLIELKPVTTSGVQTEDPIVKMIVVGRRAGRYDMKLPQFIEMLRPVMSVQLSVP